MTRKLVTLTGFRLKTIYGGCLYNNSIVEKMLPDGTKTILAGASGLSGNVNGTGVSARFIGSYALAIGSTGGLISGGTETGDKTLRKIK